MLVNRTRWRSPVPRPASVPTGSPAGERAHRFPGGRAFIELEEALADLHHVEDRRAISPSSDRIPVITIL
jgi:hypothetical protein